MIADLKPYAEYKESVVPWLGQVPGHSVVKKAIKRSGRSSAKLPKSSARAISLRQTDSCDRVAKIDCAVRCSVRATRQPELRTLIQSARQRIATVAYSTQTLLCWHVNRRLSIENLHGGRAAYGKQILATVSRELTAEYGRGFSYAETAHIDLLKGAQA